MTQKSRGLGRGLGALIPTGPVSNTGPLSSGAAEHLVGSSGTTMTAVRPKSAKRLDLVAEQAAAPQTVGGAYFAELPVGEIVPNPRQPRSVFDPDAMTELVTSLKEVGLLQPIVVRRTAEDTYELVMGERRWRASQLAGFDKVPAIVRQTEDDSMLVDALLENLHRAALNPLEEAAAYDQLLRDFACTHDVLAARIGRSRSQVSNTIRLLKLPPAVQRRVAAGVLSAGHARALLSLEDADAQEHLASRVVAEGLSVRAIEELVAIGDTGTPKKAKRAATARRSSAELDDLAGNLADRWDTRVKIQLGRGHGKLIVEFGSTEDLERIVGLMRGRR
ncbi:MAG TPA: ParB/RepB/Spo0J family partition protein [Sporichthyaceae bacterium]|nr:ParB/RepB/Spo0J family partition protein [Sporichthyaceae bacterium]